MNNLVKSFLEGNLMYHVKSLLASLSTLRSGINHIRYPFSSRHMYELGGSQRSVHSLLTLESVLFSQRALESGQLQNDHPGQLQNTVESKSNFSH